MNGGSTNMPSPTVASVDQRPADEPSAEALRYWFKQHHYSDLCVCIH